MYQRHLIKSNVFGLLIRNRVEYRFIIWLQHSGGNGFPSDIKKENGYGYFILTAVNLAKAIREGKTTAVEATQAVLDEIAAGEDTYHHC